MKKLAILSSLFLSVVAFAQGIKFEEGNFKTLLAKAKKENRFHFSQGGLRTQTPRSVDH